MSDERPCPKCGSPVPREDRTPGRGLQCRECVTAYHRDWRARNREKSNAASKNWKLRNAQHIKDRWIERTYGISREQFNDFLVAQGGLCPICHLELGDDQAVDHCHKTGRVRGILHKKCNAGLGGLGDNYLLVQRAAAYLYRTGTDGRIHPWAVIGDPPEHRDAIWAHYETGGALSFLYPIIDPTAIIGAFCTIDAGLNEPTRIGARTLCMKRTHVGHDAQIGRDCEFGAGVVICGEVVIGDGVRIGGNTWVKPLVTIGEGARIGGGSVVTKDIPASEVWAGNPAKPLRKGKTWDSARDGESDYWQHTSSKAMTPDTAAVSRG